jgi:hypothetical protein
MTRVAPTQLMDFATTSARTPGFITHLRRHFARVETALAGQARRAALAPESLRDTDLAPDDLTGAPSYDPALPFFMQSNFGLRNW